YLVKSRIDVKKQEFTGSQGCCNIRPNSRCQICKHMPLTKHINSSDNSFVFEIRGNFNCNSKNVVYVFECNVCHMQYVGETQNIFRERFNNHKSLFYSDIEHRLGNNNLSPLAAHYKQTKHGFSDFIVYIAKAGFIDAVDRKCFESFLIHKLNSYADGMNQSTGIWKKY